MNRRLVLLLQSVFVLVLFCGIAWAHMEVTANQVSVTWDAVTTLQDVNGTTYPLPEGEIIKYRLWVIPTSVDKSVEGNEQLHARELGVTPNVLYTITLTSLDDGEYWLGLQSLRVDDSDKILAQSYIGWSDDIAIVANGNTFYLKTYKAPSPACNMRPVL